MHARVFGLDAQLWVHLQALANQVDAVGVNAVLQNRPDAQRVFLQRIAETAVLRSD